LNISWLEPLTYLVPPNREENITYCIRILREWSGSVGEDKCGLATRAVVVPVEYEQTYKIVVHAVNAIGRGLPMVADLISTGNGWSNLLYSGLFQNTLKGRT